VESQRKFQPRWIAYFALVAIAATAFYFAINQTGDPAMNLDSGRIERLIPSPNTKIFQQDEVGIDLAPGYQGDLAVNGIPLPRDQVQATPELNRVGFRPGQGKAFEQWPAGENCVTATYWPSAFGPSQSQTRTWCFTVI
jgi:hypothetical protein